MSFGRGYKEIWLAFTTGLNWVTLRILKWQFTIDNKEDMTIFLEGWDPLALRSERL